MYGYEISKIGYKITTAIKGACPHCKEAIDIEKVEDLSDDMPPQEYFDKSAEMLKQNIDEYIKFVNENPTYINLNNLHATWMKRVEDLIIRSSIRSESIYVFTGDCPYCNKNIDLKIAMSVGMNQPPRLRGGEEEKTLLEWLTILKQGDLAKIQDPVRNSHFMEECPLCGEIIHLTDGGFFKKSDCPIHSIDLTNASIVKAE